MDWYPYDDYGKMSFLSVDPDAWKLFAVRKIPRCRFPLGRYEEEIEVIRPEIHLPEGAIQRIQSFLSAKDAAQTAVISKPWYAAWLTRPNLHFSDLDISTPGALVELAEKTVQRYDELNLKIQSFSLSMDDCESGKELVVKAIKLGTTDFSLTSRNFVLLLPREVLESENLVRMCLDNCKIDLQDQRVSCLRLKYLNLSRVYVEGNAFWDVISTCSLIEELVLSQCEFGEVSKQRFGVYDAHKLKVLSLKDVKIGGWFFRDLWCRFPCLKNLFLEGDIGYEELQIRSYSLEFISFNQTSEALRTILVVPGIRKFKFSGSCVPILSFRAIPREWEWESDISIMIDSTFLPTSWFLEFRKFLFTLCSSKISLYLNMKIPYSNYDIQGIMDLRKPPILVEKLTLLIVVPYSLRHPIEDGLFRCCRPSIVNLYWLSSMCRRRKRLNGFTEILHNTLITESDPKRKTHSMYNSAMHDLEEVNVEFLGTEDDDVDKYGDDDDGCWPLPYKTFPHCSDYIEFLRETKMKICHKLKWASKMEGQAAGIHK